MADQPQRVVVIDFDVSFWNLVMLFVKSAIAAIPAIIILVILGAIMSAIFAGLFAGLGHH
jgi:hypothetical protein